MIATTVQQSLDETFGEGVFAVHEMQRMGSASASSDDAVPGSAYVYYDAVLRLERDYSLTSWRGLNLGTMAFVVGATESGITGFKPKGNAKGDLLSVHGRLLFEPDGKSWKRVAAAVPKAPEAPAAAQDLRGPGPDALLRRIREVTDGTAASLGGTKDAIVVSELRRAVERIDLRIATLDGKLTLGAGPSSGTYYAFGAALVRHAARSELPAFSFSSQGSIENAALLQDRALEFALVQSDVAEVIHDGWSDEGVVPNRDLRAVASLWPEAVHLVTLEGSGIESVADLRKRRVAIGADGSGTHFNAVRIQLAAGMTVADQPDVRRMNVDRGIAALEAGEVDALFVTEAIPSPSLQALASRREDLRFLSLEPGIVDGLSEQHFAYYPRVVEAHSYPGQGEAFRTLGLACTLVTIRDVPAERVENLLSLLVDDAEALSKRYFRAGFVSADTMRLGLALPPHEGAERFYAARAKDRALDDDAAPEGAGPAVEDESVVPSPAETTP